MFFWNYKNISYATNSNIGIEWYSTTNSFSIDTRTLKPGDIFIALKGQNFDGHDFVIEAFEKGAIAAIVEYNIDNININKCPLILVENTYKALYNLASYYLKMVNTKVIAITGSVGKTTTKEMLRSVLSNYGKTHASYGNFNNHIGMSLSILQSPSDIDYLILELGMSGIGEIEALTKIAKFSIALITNVEPAHLACFSSINDIAIAKSEIFNGLLENGTAILNYDSEHYGCLLSRAKKYTNIEHIINFGTNSEANIYLESIIQNNEYYLEFTVRCFENQLSCVLFESRKHLIYCVLCVVSVIYSLGLDLAEIPQFLKNFSIPKGRGNLYKVHNFNKEFLVIDESYNASPTAVKAALENLGKYKVRRKIAILGDMLSLGKYSSMYHQDLVQCIIDNDIDVIHTVGENMKEMYVNLPSPKKGKSFIDHNHLLKEIKYLIENNDVVLIKGSASMCLNKAIHELLNSTI